MRHDGRQPQQLRKIKIETNVFKHPEGSVMIHFGDTIVNFKRNRNWLGNSRI